jgi:hypothetical protein
MFWSPGILGGLVLSGRIYDVLFEIEGLRA